MSKSHGKSKLSPTRLSITLFLFISISCQNGATFDDRPQELPPPVLSRLETTLPGISTDRISFEILQETPQTIYEIEIEDTDRIKYWLVVTDEGEIEEKREEGELSVRNGQLFREEEPFSVQAIHRPVSANSELYPDEFRKSVYALSEVGANTLAFDFSGVDWRKATISDEAARHLHNLVAELLEYRLAGVCRVLATDFPRETADRSRAIQAAGKLFRDEPQLIYWIDGANAESLVAELRHVAPKLVVAGPGGIVGIEDPTTGLLDRELVLWRRPFSEFEPGLHHVLLVDAPESYQFLEKKNRRPIENEPIQFDTSILKLEEREQGFVPLFDGQSLRGWTSINEGEESFVVSNGSIEWVRRGAGAIQFHRRFGNFILRFEYRICEGGNSGIHLRSPRANRASRIGFEVQLFGDFGQPPTKQGTGAIYSVIAPTENASLPAGHWNSVEIRTSGPLVKVEINGKLVQDVDFDTYPELRHRLRTGFIRLTDHGDYVSYRNIRIKEL
jgi:hypothetical protein